MFKTVEFQFCRKPTVAVLPVVSIYCHNFSWPGAVYHCEVSTGTAVSVYQLLDTRNSQMVLCSDAVDVYYF